MNERVGHITHLKQALVGHFLVNYIDNGEQFKFVFLGLRAEFIQCQDYPLQLLFAD
jgi:hypothetical protein